MRASKVVRTPAGLVLALCLTLMLAACDKRVDSSAWRCHSFESAGLALLLPDDLVWDETPEGSLRAQGEELQLTLTARGEVFGDVERLAAWDGDGAEAVTLGGVKLVRLPAAERSAVFDALGPHGSACRIRLTVGEDVKLKRAAALLAEIAGSVRSCAAAPADAVVHAAKDTPPPDTDYLVLVNRRRALPEDWAGRIKLVRTVNARGETVELERAACDAFFRLQKALAKEGVAVELDSAYHSAEAEGDEHPTGLGLDLYLAGGAEPSVETWARVHAALADYGFILRYPEGGQYDTGCPYAPQHIRYVGVDAAREIAAQGLTLEAYLGVDPAAIDYLVLVNKSNALPENWEDEVEIVYMTNRHGETVGVERTTYAAYCGLKEALAAEGVHLDINSAYRTVAEQKALAESYTQKYGADYVKAYVAVPGYSEHHTGLALDLYLESMDVWAKIHAHLAEYGFILRYLEGKESITGYSYEPWHARYVGVEAAREITERGITLEEYLASP